MCGRFSLDVDMDLVVEQFELPGVPSENLVPRWNIAPTQPVLVIEAVEGRRGARQLAWGLIPYYAKDGKHPLVNVRSETVLEKPFFRRLWERGQRCLIPATGFYEWKTLGKGRRQPFHFTDAQHRLFAFAGLWDRWQDKVTCTILTTTPNAVVAPLHDRMPVIVAPGNYERWLTDTSLSNLFEPAPDDALIKFPVSTFVNVADHEGRECIAPVEDIEPTLF